MKTFKNYLNHLVFFIGVLFMTSCSSELEEVDLVNNVSEQDIATKSFEGKTFLVFKNQEAFDHSSLHLEYTLITKTIKGGSSNFQVLFHNVPFLKIH